MKLLEAKKAGKKRMIFTLYFLLALAAVCLVISGCVRLWSKNQMEPGRIFRLSGNAVSTIELVERRSGKKTVVQDEETLAWAIDALNAYRYSYVFFFDKERADLEDGFELRIHNGWQWESYIFAREGFLIDGLWYGGDSITLSELSSLVTS